MVGRGSDGLARLTRDVLDGSLALGEEVDDLRPPSARERVRDRCECVEELGLGSVGHTIKLWLEYESVKQRGHRAVPFTAHPTGYELTHGDHWRTL